VNSLPVWRREVWSRAHFGTTGRRLDKEGKLGVLPVGCWHACRTGLFDMLVGESEGRSES